MVEPFEAEAYIAAAAQSEPIPDVGVLNAEAQSRVAVVALAAALEDESPLERGQHLWADRE